MRGSSFSEGQPALRLGILLTSTLRSACHTSYSPCIRTQAPGPPPNSLPTRTATSGEIGFFSSMMSWRCCREMPSRRAISDFVFPVAGTMSRRSSAPGWKGQRLGFRLALYSLTNFSFGALREYGEKLLCSMNQTRAGRGQERIVEDIRYGRFGTEFD